MQSTILTGAQQLILFAIMDHVREIQVVVAHLVLLVILGQNTFMAAVAIGITSANFVPLVINVFQDKQVCILVIVIVVHLALFIKNVVLVQRQPFVIDILCRIIILHLRGLVLLIPWLMEVPAPVIVLLGL